MFWAGAWDLDVRGAALDGSGQFVVADALVRPRGVKVVRADLVPETATPPLAWWKLDDGAGSTAVDSIAGHDATLTGGTWTNGAVDGALDFDGSTVQGDAAHASGLTLADRFTISAWFSSRDLSGTHVIIAKGSSSYNYYLATNGAELSLRFTDELSSSKTYTTSGLNLQVGQWYHVLVTLDANTDEVHYWLDGVDRYQQTGASFGVPYADTNSVHLGYSGSGDHFDGVLDDIRLWDRVLGDAEIAALAAAGTPPGGGGGGGGGGCSGTFRDEFNAQVYSGSDGSLAWASDWQEINESDGPAAGDERVFADLYENPPMPTYQMHVRDNDGGGEGVMRSLDLSGAATATLSFDYKPALLDDSNDYASVQMSTTGATGPWTEVVRFAGPADETAYQAYSTDVSAFISANAVLRIMTSPNMGSSDYVFFDNIQIECSP